MQLPVTSDQCDPRRVLRHTYQEGSGFLFLATCGGRPPATQERDGLTALRFRARGVRAAREDGIAATFRPARDVRRTRELAQRRLAGSRAGSIISLSVGGTDKPRDVDRWEHLSTGPPYYPTGAVVEPNKRTAADANRPAIRSA
jgi:hypothetical protein